MKESIDVLRSEPAPAYGAEYRRVAALLDSADSVIICAGAGMGVDSDLPDFRGADGLWREYPALRLAGIQLHEIASPAAFERVPRSAWGFYGHRLNLYREMAPHKGFDILRRWSQRLQHRHFVFTSNVDGHFQRASFDAASINECHGSIHYLQCSTGSGCGTWPAQTLVPEVDLEHCRLTNELPLCPQCGALARPNILMFNDRSWVRARQESQEQRQASWLGRIRSPLILEIGAGTTFPSVRHFAASMSTYFGRPLVRINLRESGVPSKRDVSIPRGGLEALSIIDTLIQTQCHLGGALPLEGRGS